MTSPLLALFVRSLSEEAYGRGTYWIRTALCGFILLILFALIQKDHWSGTPGLRFFAVIVASQMVAISLVGLTFFGSAIAEEKEEQTLGLLRMTDLNPVSILLGKSTSRLCSALLLLVAVFPFTIFSVTLGGVSLGQVIAAYCTIGAFTFLLCNVALLGSVLARHTTGAATFTAVVLGGMLASGPFLHELHDYLQNYGYASNFHSTGMMLWRNTPPGRFQEIFQTGFSGPPAGWQVISNLSLGAVFFLLAWAAFGRFCDRAPDDSRGLLDRGMRLLGLRNRHLPRLKTHVVARKDFQLLYGGTSAMILRFVGYLLLPLGIVATLQHQASPHFYQVRWWFHNYLPLLSFLDAGLMASRMFRSELNDQTLSTLAVLPGTVRRLTYEKAGMLTFVLVPGISFRPILDVMVHTDSWSPVLDEDTLIYFVWSILFIHAAVWFSLFLKRSAVPVAIVATYATFLLLNITISVLEARIPGNLSLETFLNIAVGAAIAVFLHFHSLRRLESLTGDG